MTPAWKFIFEALKPEPDIEKLVRLASETLDEQELLTACRDHGILLIVNAALKDAARHIFTTSGLEQWRASVASCTLHSLEFYRELQRLLSLFNEAGIPVDSFKGPILSERLFGDPLLRMSADLDFLVPRDQVAKTIDLMMGDGYQPTFDRSSLDRWLEPNSRYFHCGLLPASQKWLIEIHWALFAGWRKTSVQHKPGAGEVADDMETLLYLCNHGARHWWIQLKWVVDVDRFIRAVPGLDWQKLLVEARKRGCLRIVCLALQLAHQVCGMSFPGEVEVIIQQDPKVAALVQRVSRNWPKPKTFNPSLPWKIRYLLDCRERFSDKVGMVFDYPLLRTLSALARN